MKIYIYITIYIMITNRIHYSLPTVPIVSFSFVVRSQCCNLKITMYPANNNIGKLFHIKRYVLVDCVK